MASVHGSSSRKRGSTGEETRGDAHISGKKRKHSSDTGKYSKKRRRKEGGRKGSLRVRSVSELAKLVSSGAIRLPKRLLHYSEDKTQLLDQVFTILSPSDIKGMLPDILKGFRMKHVKQLCYEQLKKMSTHEIREAINPEEDETGDEPSLSAALRELLGQDAVAEEGRESSVDVPSGERRKKRNMEEEIGRGKSNVSASPVSDKEEQDAESSAEEIFIHVSDVSDDEGKGKVSKPDPSLFLSDTPRGGSGNETRGEHQRAQQQSVQASTEYTRISGASVVNDYPLQQPLSQTASELEDRLDLSPRGNDGIDEELHGGRDAGTQDECSEGRSEGPYSDMEEYWDIPEVPESARLLEMEFRKRALESELKRNSLQSGDQSEDRQEVAEKPTIGSRDPASHGDQFGTVQLRDIVSSEERQSCSDIADGDAHKMDKASTLELALRQRALQSLLAKKKHS